MQDTDMVGDPLTGYWWTPDRTKSPFAGTLVMRSMRSPMLTILEPHDGSVFLPHDKDIPMMHGYVESLGSVTLLQVSPSGTSFGASVVRRFRAFQAVVGVLLSKPEEKHFRTVEAVVPNLDLLLGADWPQHDILPRRAETPETPLEEPTRHWQGDGVDIAVSVRTTYRKQLREATVVQEPVLTLKSGRPKSLANWTAEWLVPFNDMLRAASGKESRLRRVSLWHKKHVQGMERHRSEMRLLTPGVGDHEVDRRGPRPVGYLSRDGSSTDLVSSIVLARQFEEDHPVFMARLSSVIGSQETAIESRYLDLMGAVEALAGALHGTEPIDRAEFKQRRKAARAELTTRESKEFFDRWMADASFYGLNKQLDALRERVDSPLMWDVPTKEMVKLRNDLAHGNVDVDLQIVGSAYDQVLGLCRSVYLAETKFPVGPKLAE